MFKAPKGGSQAVSFVGALRAQDYWGWYATLGEGDNLVVTDPVKDGVPETEGLLALWTDLSIGTGRGSTKVQISAGDLREIAPILTAYNPDAPQGSARSVAEIVKATLGRDDEFYSFKVSDEKNSRTVKVPIDAWPAFVAFISEMNADIPTQVEKFRAMIAEMNKAEREANRGK